MEWSSLSCKPQHFINFLRPFNSTHLYSWMEEGALRDTCLYLRTQQNDSIKSKLSYLDSGLHLLNPHATFYQWVHVIVIGYTYRIYFVKSFTVVFPSSLSAMTAYNPTIVALNNMLREQIRLVEQFVEINQRMYESYSTGVNSNYRYTTLEDTQQVRWIR